MRYEIKHGIIKYAADTILQDVNFEIRDTEKIAVVGRNGCGKTTLLKLIAGEIEMANLDSDEDCGISMAGRQRIGYLKQLSFENMEESVETEICKVFEPVFRIEEKMHEIEQEMENNCTDKTLHEYSSLQSQYEAMGGYTWRTDLEIMFQKFGFSLEDLNRTVGSFSGGQQTRFAFIKLLLSRPDIMLLDEPTNHLDMPTIEWLEGYLKNYDRAVVIVSHDRMFLDNVIDVTYEIEYHEMKRYPGNYSSFVEQKRVNQDKQAKDYEEQQKEIARLTAWIEKWKNTPTKVAATRSKRMVIEHMVKIEKPRRYDLKSFHAQFSPFRESYSEVLKANKLEIGYDNVLSTINMKLMKGDKVAVIGENGKGKSTLLKTLAGLLPSLGGSFAFGTDVDMGYFDQQAALEVSEHPDMTVLDDFWEEYPKLMQGEVRQALGNFMFSQDDVFKKLGQLSGGEKVRLALCKLFKKRPNLLLLDEPTNHMDIVGKEALEWMLKQYKGTVLFVSHDRYFIKEVATAVLVFEQDGVRYYPYGYTEYMRIMQEQKSRQTTESVSEYKNQNKYIQTTKKLTVKKDPTLSDVPNDKTSAYNPGKEAAKRKRLLEKLEGNLEESQNRLLGLRIQQVDPDISSDYEQLTDIQQQIEEEEQTSDRLLDEIAELEVKVDEQEIL